MLEQQTNQVELYTYPYVWWNGRTGQTYHQENGSGRFVGKLFAPTLVRKMTSEFHRLGFRSIIIVTGHYGHNQQIVVREVAVKMSERLQIPVLRIPEYWLALDAGYLGDHAGIGNFTTVASRTAFSGD